jgi:CHAD domain-containing protein
MATEVRETERKYELEPGAALPSLLDLPHVASQSDPDEQTLEAEYYDTEGLHLIRAGVTLRRRRGGTDSGWHLKLPLDADSRREIRVPLGRTGRRVPAELAVLVRAYARGATLRPVALLTTTRRLRVLLDKAGQSLAEVATDDVSAQSLGESTTLSQWREVEVELTGGGSGLLRAADERLRRSGLHPAGHSAKLERALADRLPQPARERPLTPRSPAADVVLGYGRAHAALLPALDPLIRRDEAGAVHDMRVAIRRLRSTLKTFGEILDRPGASDLAAELKWLGGVLGEVRDHEVLSWYLQARLAQLPAELVIGPVQARVRAHFAPRAASARTALLEALDSGRYIMLLDDLDRFLASPGASGTPAGGMAAGGMAGRPAEEVLPAAVRRPYRRARKRARRVVRAPAGRTREIALHETRKAAKDARYAAEAAGPSCGKDARRLARRMKGLQSVLGDHHDAVQARDIARDIGVRAHLAGENAFTFGLLHEGCERDALLLEVRAQKAWKRAFRTRYSSWLR